MSNAIECRGWSGDAKMCLNDSFFHFHFVVNKQANFSLAHRFFLFFINNFIFISFARVVDEFYFISLFVFLTHFVGSISLSGVWVYRFARQRRSPSVFSVYAWQLATHVQHFADEINWRRVCVHTCIPSGW